MELPHQKIWQLGPGKTRTHCGGNIVSCDVARSWENEATLRAARTQQMFLKIFRKYFVSDTNVARVAKRGHIWETWSRRQCCRHIVSSFCWPLTSDSIRPHPHSLSPTFIYLHSLPSTSAFIHIHMPPFTFIHIRLHWSASIRFHSPSTAFIHHHVPSSTFACIHPSSFTFICLHSTLSASIHSHPHWSASICFHPHWSASIRCHPHSSASIRSHPHWSASIRFHPHSSACICFHPPSSASIHFHLGYGGGTRGHKFPPDCSPLLPQATSLMLHNTNILYLQKRWLRVCTPTQPNTPTKRLVTAHDLANSHPALWVVVRRCRARWSDRLNALSHCVHSNGLSPVCVRRCLVRALDRLNAWPHCVHLNGFSPVWIHRCAVRFLPCLTVFPHNGHLFPPVATWVLRCCVWGLRILHRTKNTWVILHEQIFGIVRRAAPDSLNLWTAFRSFHTDLCKIVSTGLWSLVALSIFHQSSQSVPKMQVTN